MCLIITDLWCDQDNVDVLPEVHTIVLHHTQQEAVAQAQGGTRLHGGQDAGVQLGLKNGQKWCEMTAHKRQLRATDCCFSCCKATASAVFLRCIPYLAALPAQIAADASGVKPVTPPLIPVLCLSRLPTAPSLSHSTTHLCCVTDEQDHQVAVGHHVKDITQGAVRLLEAAGLSLSN